MDKRMNTAKNNMMRPSLSLVTLTAALMSGAVYAAPKAADVPMSPLMPTAEQSAQAQNPAQLAYNAQDTRLDDEQRAEALMALANYPSQNALVAVARGLKDDSAQIRHGAVVGAEAYQIEHRWRMVSPLLIDEAESVRLRATINLVRDYSALTPEQQSAMAAPVDALIAYLAIQGDAESSLLMANVYRWTKQWSLAEPIYRTLIEQDTHDTSAWLAYADNYRGQQKNAQAITILDQAIDSNPDTAALYYSKSLALVRLDDKTQAAQEIDVAANLAKDNSYYWYLNGVLQEALDIDKSTKSFETAYLISGAPEQLYALCDIYVRYGHEKSQPCLDELSQVAPAYVLDELKSKQNANVTQ